MTNQESNTIRRNIYSSIDNNDNTVLLEYNIGLNEFCVLKGNPSKDHGGKDNVSGFVVYTIDTFLRRNPLYADNIKTVRDDILRVVNENEPTDHLIKIRTSQQNLMIECSECSHKYSKRAEKCPKCGASIRIPCNICNAEIPKISEICPECGDPYPFTIQEVPASKVDPQDARVERNNNESNPTNDKTKFCNLSDYKAPQLSSSDILFSLKGRINRKQFWSHFLPIWAPLLLSLANTSVEYNRYSHEYVYSFRNVPLGIITIIYAFSVAWPLLAIQVKRWHDRGKSGVWVFVNGIPLVGTIWTLIELGLLKGTKGKNKYDSDQMVFSAECTNSCTVNESTGVMNDPTVDPLCSDGIIGKISVEEESTSNLETDIINKEYEAHQKNSNKVKPDVTETEYYGGPDTKGLENFMKSIGCLIVIIGFVIVVFKLMF